MRIKAIVLYFLSFYHVTKNQLVWILIFLGFCAVAFFITHGITFYDEGYILYGAERILRGQVPYRDFHFAYTPLSLYVTALSFKIFGTRVLAGRILMVVINFLGAYFIYLLLKPFVKHIIFTYLVICAYIFWGIGHINFPWPVMFAIPTGMIHSLLLYKWYKKSSLRFAFLGGIFVILTFLFKQNFGIVLGIQTFLTFLFFREFRNIRFVLFYLLGVFFAMLPYVGYLIYTNSLVAFIDDFYTYTIMRVIVEKTLDTPFLYEDSLYGVFVKLFFYVLPLYLSCIAFFKGLQKERSFLIIVFFVVLYYFSGIRPTTDYPHLVPLLALSAILLPFIITHAKQGIEKYIAIVFTVVFILLGLWTSLYKNYYRYEQPLMNATTFVKDKRTNIWIWEDKARTIAILQNEITKKTRSNESIFVYHYSPFIYFVTERENPSMYDIHPSNERMMRYYQEVVNSLEKKQTRYVVTLGNISPTDKSLLGTYIQKYYKPKTNANDYLIWERKS